MGIFIFDEASTIRAVRCDNIVRLALGVTDQPDEQVSLRLSAGFSPTTRSSNELGMFEKTAVGKADSEDVRALKALHVDLLDLMAGKTECVNITDVEYPRKPKRKSTPKTERPSPEKSEENQP